MRNRFFQEKLVLNDLVKEYSFLICIFGKFITRRRFKRTDSDTADTLYDFFMETFRLPIGSERSLHYVVNPNIIAFQPLEDVIVEMEMPILICYGTEDWMDDRGAKRLKEKKKENFQLFYINESGHNIPIDNSKDIVNHIINDAIKENQEMLEVH